jgi:hypothetical protein
MRFFRVLFLIPALLFAVSLFLPAVYQSNSPASGAWLLAFGWLGILRLQVAWLANPIGLAAFMFALSNRLWPAAVLGCVALVISLTAFMWRTEPSMGEGGGQLVVHPGIGMYLWISSFAALLFCVLLQCALFRPGNGPRIVN